MKWMLIEYYLKEYEPTGCKRTVFSDYGLLLEKIQDEHYARGVCLAFAVVASDDDGDFPNIDKIAESLAGV